MKVECNSATFNQINQSNSPHDNIQRKIKPPLVMINNDIIHQNDNRDSNDSLVFESSARKVITNHQNHI